MPRLIADQIELEPEPEVIIQGNYFTSENKSLELIPSGCCLLNCIIGGGWSIGRIANIVGDRSVGKTLLAIEASANFALKYPRGRIFYREAEAAFDIGYAEALGMPVDRVEFSEEGKFDTVEDFFEDLDGILSELIKQNVPGLYIVDSLDALSDREELHREIDKATYGANKAKQMSSLLRRLARKVKLSRMCVIIISQVRDNIGAMFGEKSTRSGGRALDFYASQVVYLTRLGSVKRTIKGIERPIGIKLRARCTKNKIGLERREAEFELHFGYGVDNLGANVEWLLDVGRLDVLEINQDRTAAKRYLKLIDSITDDNVYKKTLEIVDVKVRNVWSEIETLFLPTRKKYNQI